MLAEVASAKINIYLHVGPLRRDGLHDLASLFAFVDVGDLIEAREADALSLETAGRFSGPLESVPVHQNLVWRAGDALRRAAGVATGAAIRLDKRLPIASGVGGGSADAAAALRLLNRLWGLHWPLSRLEALAFRLGADVPACLYRRPVLVSGAGETIAPAASLPPMWACLVNSGVKMPTGPVFRAFDRANEKPPEPRHPAIQPSSIDQLQNLKLRSRNDLEGPAITLAPSIAATISWLSARPGVLLARMSGSGATAFGLFSSAEAARRVERQAVARGWWAASGRILSR